MPYIWVLETYDWWPSFFVDASLRTRVPPPCSGENVASQTALVNSLCAFFRLFLILWIFLASEGEIHFLFSKKLGHGARLYILYRPKASESTLSDGNLQNLIQFEQFAPLQCMECMDKYSRCFCQEALRLASLFPQARASPFQASPAFGEWISPLFFQICLIYAAALGDHSLDLQWVGMS